jgi:hypothetical protein
MPSELDFTEERRASIDRMIEDYRVRTQRRLLRRAIKLWRRSEADRTARWMDAARERTAH